MQRRQTQTPRVPQRAPLQQLQKYFKTSNFSGGHNDRFSRALFGPVNTDDNLADPFTKVLPKFKYQKFVDIWLTA